LNKQKYGSKWAIYGQPCPSCGSSDAVQIDVNGNGWCFSCNKFHKQYYEAELTEKEDKVVKEEFDFWGHRGVSRHTFEFLDVVTKFRDGAPVETAFTWPEGGQRIRRMGDHILKKDRFTSVGPMSNPGLLFKDKFDPGSKEGIVICSSGYDAASIVEITGRKLAAVAVSSETSAKRDVVKDWDYVNSFKKIYICMDNDETGHKATAELAPLFDYQRVYHVELTLHKDANDYLQSGQFSELKAAIDAAGRFAPDNLISGFDDILQALRQDKEAQIATYPFSSIQKATYGIHEGEIILVKAPEGVGKTEFFRATEHWVLQQTDVNIGIIHLEEDNATTIKALAGYQLRVPATLPDCGLSEDDILLGYRGAVKDDAGRVHIYISFDRENEDLLFNTIRFLVAAVGCKIIFFDHITWMAVGGDTDDERRKLDRISQGLKLLAKELRFALVMISHVNAQGGSRGSKNIDFTANTIISISRDNKSPSDIVRRTTNFMLDKVRLGGRTGPAGRALFDPLTGRLEDFSSDEQLAIDYSQFDNCSVGELDI